MAKLFCLLGLFLLTACSNSVLEDVTFPADQKSAQLAFQRMSKHGRMEPVLEDGQQFTDWQFLIQRDDGVRLSDGSGIEYVLDQASVPPSITEMPSGSLIKVSGIIRKVERDLIARTVTAELSLTESR